MKTLNRSAITIVVLLATSCSKEPLNSPKISVETESNIIAQSTEHYIGERFGGGIIFYLDSIGQHGLITDTVDLPAAKWAIDSNQYTGTGAKGIRLGSGNLNTRKIVLTLGKINIYAALECAKSRRGGFTDWFLPSKDEWTELFKQKNVVGGFPGNLYWSSSESKQNGWAWTTNSFTGAQLTYGKPYIGSVRAIRRF